MICNSCGQECVGFPTGNPKEDICSDCAFPALKAASEAASRAVEEDYFERTGERKTSGEILRGMLDRWSESGDKIDWNKPGELQAVYDEIQKRCPNIRIVEQ